MPLPGQTRDDWHVIYNIDTGAISYRHSNLGHTVTVLPFGIDGDSDTDFSMKQRVKALGKVVMKARETEVEDNFHKENDENRAEIMLLHKKIILNRLKFYIFSSPKILFWIFEIG